MTKCKKITAFLSVIIVALSVIATAIPASAANVCYNVRGNLTQTVKFEVQVGKKIFSSDKVVLTQSKGNTLQSWYGKEKVVGLYGRFYVSVYDETARKWIYNNKEWQDKKFTISGWKLKKNHTYTVTVVGKNTKHIFDGYDYTPYVFKKWLSYPSWSVSKTGGNIKLCK
ncbi:MAG: hypothetical protein IJA08_05500 [Clostridia bacterium]|nr:hypothetical protein [Clostridia bacterium]